MGERVKAGWDVFSIIFGATSGTLPASHILLQILAMYVEPRLSCSKQCAT
jgi:hypothetical protein